MLNKILFLVTLIVVSTAYTEENNVLVLTADDFPSITTEFQYILIEFYAPWCGHCKKLAPIYDQVATELKNQGSPVRLAKIDCDQHGSVKSTYGVQGFPTLKFFIDGQKQDYNGQRSKQFMVNWLSKKTRDPVIAITSAQLQALQNDKVNVVFHGDIKTQSGKTFTSQAKLDDYNTYYNVQESSLAEGTVQIYRPFGQKATSQGAFDLKSFISKNERPTVYPFNDRTISDIFSERKVGIILFDSPKAGYSLNDAFAAAAHQLRNVDGKEFVFSNIASSEQHYGGLAQYIKIDVHKSPIVLLNAGSRIKHVLIEDPVQITAQSIVKFIANVQSSNSKEYKMDEQVSYQEADAAVTTDQEL